MMYACRAREALQFAFDLHREQTRKGSGVPYVTHLLAVAAIVGEYGGNEDQFIAALLHDAVEDQGGPPVREEIRTRFGETVAALVDGCTDTDEQPKPPWRARKEAYLGHLAQAPPALRLIVAADKLHNALAITRDCEEQGNAAFARFNGGREGTLWYYRVALATLAQGWQHPILIELERATARMHAAAGARESFTGEIAHESAGDTEDK